MRCRNHKLPGLLHPLPGLLGATAAASACFCALAVTAPFGADGAVAPAPAAHTARTTYIDERGQLRLVSKHGFTLDERGTATGTIRGSIGVQLKIVSSSRVTAEVTIYPNGGSISGDATASYRKGETVASFSGSLTVNRGTGSYGRAQGSGLSFSGTIARSNDAIAVHVSGRLST
jgi:hypothetical protein